MQIRALGLAGTEMPGFVATIVLRDLTVGPGVCWAPQDALVLTPRAVGTTASARLYA